jgi:hypothetical protein
MSLDEHLKAFWDKPENRIMVITWGGYATSGMVVLGFLIMIYLLFFQ